MVEINLACVCASLPIFWPVFTIGWSGIMVTYEVNVTREYGIFVPRKRLQPPQTASSDGAAARGSADEAPVLLPPLEWDPYVGDEKTGLGDSETIIASPADRPARQGGGRKSFFV